MTITDHLAAARESLAGCDYDSQADWQAAIVHALIDIAESLRAIAAQRQGTIGLVARFDPEPQK